MIVNDEIIVQPLSPHSGLQVYFRKKIAEKFYSIKIILKIQPWIGKGEEIKITPITTKNFSDQLKSIFQNWRMWVHSEISMSSWGKIL